MNLDISNLPNDFYGDDLFPINKYILSKDGFSYSIGGICKSPFGIGEIFGINDRGIDIKIINGKKEYIGKIYSKIDIKYINIILGIVDKLGNTKKGDSYDFIINEEKKESDYNYNDNLTLEEDHNKNYIFFERELDKEYKNLKSHNDGLENLINMDNKDKQEYFAQGGIFEPYNDSKVKDFKNMLDCAYFYFLIDGGTATYISSYIGLQICDGKIIEKYTSSRWGLLKNNYSLGDKRKKIIVKGDKIIKETSDYNSDKCITISENNNNFKSERKDTIKPKGMGDISSLMFLEQDKIMRSDYLGTTLITGVAGSGKTNLLLHRIDYLLSEFPDKFLEGKISVFCFNLGLKDYVSKMINSKFPNVKVFSKDKYFRDLCIKFLGVGFNYQNKNIDTYYIKTLYNKIFECIISQQELINKKLRKREKEIINEIIDGKEKESSSKIKEFNISFKKIFKEEISKNEFDYILYFISTLKTKKRLNLENKYETYIEIDNEYYKNNTTLKTSLNFEFNKNRYFIEILEIKGLEINNFDHIFIDEVQDLKSLEVKILNNMNSKGMTIAGDISQIITNNNFTDFGKYFGIKIDRQYEIKMSHRSSLQTVLFSNQFIENIKGSIQAEQVGFIGDKPEITISLNKNIRANKILEIIKKISDLGKTICIINESKTDAEKVVNWLLEQDINTYYAERDLWDFSRKIHVSNYFQVKGLEFDYVVLLGSNKLINKNKQQILYTASTRAKEKLYIIEENLGIYSKFNDNTYDLIKS